MYKSYSMELAGRTLTVDIGRVCAQANGAALLKIWRDYRIIYGYCFRQAERWR